MADYGFKQPPAQQADHKFSKVPKADIPRSRFDRSHGYKTTIDSGYLYPVYLDEVLPGDTFSMSPTVLARLATPLHPVMDNMYIDTFFFFVPNRLLWDNWQKFMGERRPNTDSSIDYLTPTITTPFTPAEGSLADYFGLPIGKAIRQPVSALPFRAYNLIYNEWFRDQNLINMVTENNGDGPDALTDYALLRRGKRHDYFTGALPWPQKGPSVAIPISGTFPVVGMTNTGNANWVTMQTSAGNQALRNLESVTGTNTIRFTSTPDSNSGMRWPEGVSIGAEVEVTDLSNTINEWREAFQLQRFLERDARGGTRYTELLLSHFGVSSPDARLQRPEYLGGGSQPVGITPVPAQTDTVDHPVGELGGVGMTVSTSGGFTKSFVEHGIIIGLVSVRADLTYQQGLERFWSRQTRYDHYWPVFAHLGEQAILNQELWYTDETAGPAAANTEAFGYQERYAEYRYKPSRITGQFRSDAALSLDTWHLSQDFATLPVLGPTFINETPPIERIIAVPTQPEFLLDCWFRLQCARPMPTYSVPGLIDHF